MKVLPKISDAEWEVMKVLWKQAPCSAQTVIEAVAKPQSWSAATVKTLLNRLVRKGAVRYEKNGRAYVYSAAITEAEGRHTETISFLDRVFDGALSPLLAHFTQRGEKLKAEDIAALEKLLRDSRK